MDGAFCPTYVLVVSAKKLERQTESHTEIGIHRVGHYLWNNFANCGGAPVCGTGLPGPLGLGEGLAAAEEAAEAAAATGNNAIDISSNAFDHVIDTHTAGGATRHCVEKHFLR